MGSRNVLTLLIVVFVAVLLYNVLHFTGVVGGFGTTRGVAPLPQDDRFDLPGLAPRAVEPPSVTRPQASGTTTPSGRRGVTAADLSLTSDWGRNPFFTPAEIWALANYRPVYVTDPGTVATGLLLNGIVIDSTGRRVAIINNDIVGVGDVLGGMTIVDMGNDTVVFRLADGQRH